MSFSVTLVFLNENDIEQNLLDSTKSQHQKHTLHVSRELDDTSFTINDGNDLCLYCQFVYTDRSDVF